MIQDRLNWFLRDAQVPATFEKYHSLLAANVIEFPPDATVPNDPNSVYGRGWSASFRLPGSPVGIEDSQSLIVFQDTKSAAVGIEEIRRFLFVQPRPRAVFPVDFYLAWGTCSLSLTGAPARMWARIAKEGEWFVGEPHSEFSDGHQLALALEKCGAMIGPGVTTAVEQLAYLIHARRGPDAHA